MGKAAFPNPGRNQLRNTLLRDGHPAGDVDALLQRCEYELRAELAKEIRAQEEQADYEFVASLLESTSRMSYPDGPEGDWRFGLEYAAELIDADPDPEEQR